MLDVAFRPAVVVGVAREVVSDVEPVVVALVDATVVVVVEAAAPRVDVDAEVLFPSLLPHAASSVAAATATAMALRARLVLLMPPSVSSQRFSPDGAPERSRPDWFIA